MTKKVDSLDLKHGSTVERVEELKEAVLVLQQGIMARDAEIKRLKDGKFTAEEVRRVIDVAAEGHAEWLKEIAPHMEKAMKDYPKTLLRKQRELEQPKKQKDTGLDLIKAACEGQYNPGYKLVDAAICYADYPDSVRVPRRWPWPTIFWRPGLELYSLTKAGALIVAEIDRLLGLE